MMKNIYKNTLRLPKVIPIALCLGYLTGCASYNAMALNNLSPDFMTSSTTQTAGIRIAAKSFSKADCKRYLDRDVISVGYQPVQLFVQNNTNKSYSFSLNRITLPHARPEEVAEKVHTSTVGRAAGYGAAALIIWPFVIPAVVDGVKSSQANESLDNDFHAKAAKDQTIDPHSYINTLIFVPTSSYKDNFIITLIDQETNEPVLLSVSASDRSLF